ncbi:MAG: hypothetical protein QOJ16_2839 [Acidobacteriota bacterium]|nr:hypothetical protein [Acidobacteriota bacterium]
MSRRIAMTLVLGLFVVLAGGAGVAAFAQGAGPAAHGPIFTPKDLTWGPAPPILNPGAQIAVLEGDPSQSGPFTIRLKLPDGFKIMPHSHPTTEHVTVISGVMNAAMGDTFDKSKGAVMPVGSYAVLPAKMNHYAWVKGATILQVHGEGPFQINYVNPADDPSQKGKASGTKP